MADITNRLEDYFIKYDMPYKKIGDNMWTLSDESENIDNIVVSYDDPSVIFRTKFVEVPSKNKDAFFEKLLRLNAESMVYGAYGLENNNVVIVDTLEAENLDYNEFAASIDAIKLALIQDYPKLKEYLK